MSERAFGGAFACICSCMCVGVCVRVHACVCECVCVNVCGLSKWPSTVKTNTKHKRDSEGDGWRG